MKMPKDKSMDSSAELNCQLGNILYATDAAMSAFMVGDVLARIHNKIISDSCKINKGRW